MKAWGASLDPSGKSGIRFLADTDPGEYTRALDLAFDGKAIFGGDRSKRYAIVVKDGKVESLHVEPDNTGVDGMFDPRVACSHNSMIKSSLLTCVGIQSRQPKRFWARSKSKATVNEDSRLQIIHICAS